MEPLEKNFSRPFSWEETAEILEQASQKHNLVVSEDGKSFVADDKLRLTPPFLIPPKDFSVKDYLGNLDYGVGSQLLILIQAGAAALGIWKDGELCQHKVITKYMVRKKQGKAQITYMNQKGKSRAGSRIRLRESMDFFVEINEKLEQWEEDIAECEQLLYSCTVRLWREVFVCKTPPPFDKNDERWRKIPLDVRVPNFKELKHVFYVLSHGSVEAEDEII